MRLEDLFSSSYGQNTYDMQADPIYGPLFANTVAKQGGTPRGPDGVSAGNVPNSGKWEDLARQIAARKYGWGPGEFKNIDWIISGGGPNKVTAESGWNPGAVNPSSGAYGIPQILPAAHPGTNLQNDPQGQVRWLLNYIKDRYGTPAKAYQFKSQKNWY